MMVVVAVVALSGAWQGVGLRVWWMGTGWEGGSILIYLLPRGQSGLGSVARLMFFKRKRVWSRPSITGGRARIPTRVHKDLAKGKEKLRDFVIGFNAEKE